MKLYQEGNSIIVRAASRNPFGIRQEDGVVKGVWECAMKIKFAGMNFEFVSSGQ